MTRFLVFSILVMMSLSWLASPVHALSQKDFHERLSIMQFITLGLDHALDQDNMPAICQAIHGEDIVAVQKALLADRSNLMREQLNTRLNRQTLDLINEFHTSEAPSEQDSERFFNVHLKKAEEFKMINQERLAIQKDALYPLLKSSQYFSKASCQTGDPWPSTLSDIRTEMETITLLKPLGDTFQSTYRSLLQ